MTEKANGIRLELLRSFYEQKLNLIVSSNEIGLGSLREVSSKTLTSKHRILNTEEEAAMGLKKLSSVLHGLISKKPVFHKAISDQVVCQVLPKGVKDRRKKEINVKRRIYDILNIFIAIRLICKKDKVLFCLKDQNTQDYLKKMLKKKRKEVEDKRKNLRGVLLRFVTIQNLIQRNSSSNNSQATEKVFLPFVVTSNPDSDVNRISIATAQNRQNLYVKSYKYFKILDDLDVLQALKLHNSTLEFLSQILPSEELIKYCPDTVGCSLEDIIHI